MILTSRSLILTLSLFGCIPFLAATSAQAQDISLGKAAELALHRIERLVILKKVEASFQTKLKTLKLEALSHQTVNEPAFKATAFQYPGSDGSQKQLEILLNGVGKALSDAQTPGGDALDAPEWPESDAATLAESALHHVTHGASQPQFRTYSANFSTLTLTQGLSSTGSMIAVVDVTALDDEPVLRIKLKLDGTVESTELVSHVLSNQ